MTDLSQKAVLNQMFYSQNELNTSFSNLVAVTGSGQGTGPVGVSQELKEFSASTLEGQTQMLMSRASELSQLVKAEAHDVEQRIILVILFSIALLMLFVLLTYLFINRSVLRSISALHDGVKRIRSGDLDTQIETISNDELGYLSQTFNDMASSLANSRNLLLASNSVLEKEITEHKLAENALRENEEALSSMLNAVTEAALMMNSEGIILAANETVARRFGRKYAADLIGQRALDLLPADLQKSRQQKIQEVIRTGQPVHFEDSRNNRIIDQTIYPVRAMDGTVDRLAIFGIDITERKQAEAQIQNSRQLLQTIIDNSQILIYAKDLEGYFIMASESLAELFGQPRDQLLGKTSHDFLPKAIADQHRADDLEVMARKSPLHFEEIIGTKDGIHTYLTTKFPLTDIDGEIYAICGASIDITGRKQADDSLLKINQKLNVISQLTRKNLTNQIFILNSYLDLAKNQLAGQDHIIETIQKCITAIRSVNKIIEYSKDYQDMGAQPPKWQNVNMTMLFGLSHISIGNIQHSLETENLEIFADSLLEKVCQRLFENSMKHGDHVTCIHVWYTITPEGATIFFEDNGIGIPPGRKEQIFLRSGGGTHTSMRSLVFVREILDITGITITETGEPGKGARFEMKVPKGAYRFTATGEK